MSTHTAAKSKRPLVERRGTSTPSPLSRLTAVFKRPMALQRDNGKLKLVLVERRRTPRGGVAEVKALCTELRARLVAHRTDHSAHVVRHLAYVYKGLSRKGWSALDLVPSDVLGKALVQAEMLAAADPSLHMTALLDGLRLRQAAAAAREERLRANDPAAALEVSEASHEEFEAMSRNWTGFSELDEPDTVAELPR